MPDSAVWLAWVAALCAAASVLAWRWGLGRWVVAAPTALGVHILLLAALLSARDFERPAEAPALIVALVDLTPRLPQDAPPVEPRAVAALSPSPIRPHLSPAAPITPGAPSPAGPGAAPPAPPGPPGLPLGLAQALRRRADCADPDRLSREERDACADHLAQGRDSSPTYALHDGPPEMRRDAERKARCFEARRAAAMPSGLSGGAGGGIGLEGLAVTGVGDTGYGKDC